MCLQSGEEAEEEEARPLDCFTVPVDWSVLKPLKGAQYWYVPNKAIDRQVDSSLSIDHGPFNTPLQKKQPFLAKYTDNLSGRFMACF